MASFAALVPMLAAPLLSAPVLAQVALAEPAFDVGAPPDSPLPPPRERLVLSAPTSGPRAWEFAAGAGIGAVGCGRSPLTVGVGEPDCPAPEPRPEVAVSLLSRPYPAFSWGGTATFDGVRGTPTELLPLVRTTAQGLGPLEPWAELGLGYAELASQAQSRRAFASRFALGLDLVLPASLRVGFTLRWTTALWPASGAAPLNRAAALLLLSWGFGPTL